MPLDGEADNALHCEEDLSYAKSFLGVKTEDKKPGNSKLLGVQWNLDGDEFHFDFRDVISAMAKLKSTKRHVASAMARFSDHLGVAAPVMISFKMFYQQLCEAKIGWDDILTGSLLEKWNYLLMMMKGARKITIPHYLS